MKSYVNALDLKVDTTELYYINTQISSFKADIAKLEEALNPASLQNVQVVGVILILLIC